MTEHKYRLEELFGKPEVINEVGTAWWVDKDTSNYTKSIELGVFVVIVESLGGHTDRLILDKKTRNVLYAHQQLEAICVRLDIMKYLNDNPDKEAKTKTKTKRSKK